MARAHYPPLLLSNIDCEQSPLDRSSDVLSSASDHESGVPVGPRLQSPMFSVF